MLQTFLASFLIIAIALALLCVRLWFVKDGRFPDTHVGGSKALKKRGVHCAKAQDREARHKKKLIDILTE